MQMICMFSQGWQQGVAIFSCIVACNWAVQGIQTSILGVEWLVLGEKVACILQ